MTTYYICPVSLATVFDEEFPSSAPLDSDGVTPCTPVSLAVYNAQVAANDAAIEFAYATFLMNLRWSRSKLRTKPEFLDQELFSSTELLAIFVEEDPYHPLGVTSVEFYLDAVLVNTEASAPWDYAATDGFGNANRVTFAVGTHTVDAKIFYPSGNFTVSATFEVE